MTAKALLSLENSVFLRCFTTDLKVSAWVFGEMKALVKKIATKQAISTEMATNLLSVVVRVLAAEPHEVQLDQLAQRGVFSVARILVMCSLYAQSNRQAMEWCMERLFQRAPVLKDQMTMVIPMFTQVLVDIHQRVNMLKAHDENAMELLDQISDITHSLNAMTICSPTILEMLTPPGESIHHAFNGNTILYAIFVSYECDLPMLSSLNPENEVWQQSIAKTRSYCLNLLDTWMEHHFLSILRINSSQAEDACEGLFGVIDILLHGNNAPAIMTDNGTFLSDYNQLYNFKATCTRAFQQAQIDEARADYLALMLDKLPLRPSAKQQKPVAQKQPQQSQESNDDKLLLAISQVQEVFPDLGDGFLELCIKAYNYEAEQAIMGLLEENLPEAIAPLDRSLRKTDAAYQDIVNPKPKETLKADQIWVGKKKQPAAYKPESAKEDADYAAKTQALIMSYDEEPPLWLDAPTNEYNDDYNDELEDYTPFSANDEMDYEEIKARNKVIRAQEAEDAFWESMRNRNHIVEEESNESNEEEEVKEQEKPSTERKMVTTKNGAVVAEDKTASSDVKKQSKNRARKEHNKAKVGNHNRKDGARRKQAKGMV